jgi:hypothetical protein
MSFTRKTNEECIKEDDKLINTGYFDYIINNSMFENTGPCEIKNDNPSVKNPRHYHLFNGINLGMDNSNIDVLVDRESNLFNLSLNLSNCSDKKYKPNDCHKNNSECDLNKQINIPAIGCNRIQTNISHTY